MRNDIYNIFEEGLASSIENIVRCFEKMNCTTDQIVDKINDMPSIFRSGLHLTALSAGNEELAKKISAANEIIKLRKIDEFKNAVANGVHEEFLSDMSLDDKAFLSVGIEKLEDGKDLTEEEQKCSDIIKKSIAKDIEREKLNDQLYLAHHVQGRDNFSVKTDSQYIPRKIKK